MKCAVYKLFLLTPLVDHILGLQPTASPTVNEFNPVLLGKISFPHPSFLSFASVFSKRDLVITQFSSNGPEAVSIVTNIESYFNSTLAIPNLDIKTLGNDYTWPNDAGPIPKAVFTQEEQNILCSENTTDCSLIAVPDGFLVPGHKTGGVYILPGSTQKLSAKIPITKSETNWFYHQIHWVDLDKDGRADVVAARTNMDAAGRTEGELVWLRHPESVSVTTPWEMKVLSKGPDVITLPIVGNDGLLYIFAAEFFSERLSVTKLNLDVVVDYTVLDDKTGPLEGR